jgi:hypothetical protein
MRRLVFASLYLVLAACASAPQPAPWSREDHVAACRDYAYSLGMLTTDRGATPALAYVKCLGSGP